jgi:hypothetical protein
MHSFVVIPILLGFSGMATMQWGLEVFFAGQFMQVHQRFARLLKFFIMIVLGVGAIVTSLIGITTLRDGQPVVDPISYLFMMANLPVAFGALMWGFGAFGFNNAFSLVMRGARLVTLLAVPLGCVLYFTVAPLEHMILGILFLAILFMIPGAMNWGLEFFGYTLLKPNYWVVRFLRVATSLVVLLPCVVSGLIGLLLLPGLIVRLLVH